MNPSLRFPGDLRTLHLGIDQHKRQLTVNLRGEDGSVILKRRVSKQWEKVRTFVTVHGREGGGQVHVFGERLLRQNASTGRKMDQSPAAP